MANFTAADVKALREQTGAGMMDVKKALTEADGDAEKALEIIRLKGLKSLSKREGRQASAGLLAAQTDGTVGVLVEVNSETDFVAKNQKFIDFSNEVLAAAVASAARRLRRHRRRGQVRCARPRAARRRLHARLPRSRFGSGRRARKGARHAREDHARGR